MLAKPEPWTESAVCAQTDPDVFHPEAGGSTREAKRICAGCPVITECLEYALTHNERFGVWGGMSKRARQLLVRDRRKSARCRVCEGVFVARPNELDCSEECRAVSRQRRNARRAS